MQRYGREGNLNLGIRDESLSLSHLHVVQQGTALTSSTDLQRESHAQTRNEWRIFVEVDGFPVHAVDGFASSYGRPLVVSFRSPTEKKATPRGELDVSDPQFLLDVVSAQRLRVLCG